MQRNTTRIQKALNFGMMLTACIENRAIGMPFNPRKGAGFDGPSSKNAQGSHRFVGLQCSARWRRRQKVTKPVRRRQSRRVRRGKLAKHACIPLSIAVIPVSNPVSTFRRILLAALHPQDCKVLYDITTDHGHGTSDESPCHGVGAVRLTCTGTLRNGRLADNAP